jgi:hypothetical protein
MANPSGVEFKIGDLFPADDAVARWITVCAMALNDLLLVNRWLVPSLENDGPAYIHLYLARLGAGHLFEVATFLHLSERRVPEVAQFVRGLDENVAAAYERVKSATPPSQEPLARQLKHARDHFFHYAQLLPHDTVEFENLRRAMVEHANTRGEIRDGFNPLGDFRALYADDIATELTFPEAEIELEKFLGTVADCIGDYLRFVRGALTLYVNNAPSETWDYTSAASGAMPELNWRSLASASMHPLQLRILERAVDGDRISAVELAREFEAKLGDVSYHIRALHERGLLKKAGTRARRRAVQHFYSIANNAVT